MSTFTEKDKLEHEVIRLYQYGSTVYRTNTNNSDEDFIAVVKSEEPMAYNVKGDVDYLVYSEGMFIEAIKEHKIDVLECIFLDNEDPYREYFRLDLKLLRKEISSVSSNSYVKCKKKLQDGEVYIGLKSLFHSLRILDFGIQIVKYGEIKDYTSSNKHLNDIMSIGGNWDTLHNKYKPLYNSLKTEFRKLCPLG